MGITMECATDTAEAIRAAGGEPLAPLGELRQTLGSAMRLLDELESLAPPAPPAPTTPSSDLRSLDASVARLREELRASEADREALTQRMVATDQQASRLTSLYVVTYQLHSTLDPEEVQSAIAEIALDLLGAERFALLLRADGNQDCRIALRRGMENHPHSRFAGPVYTGGDALVDRGLGDGRLQLGPQAGSEALAVVPLRIQDSVAGALVLCELLAHRSKPLGDDRELLDLIAAHAASALLAANAYATARRKVNTLQGLLTLLQGP